MVNLFYKKYSNLFCLKIALLLNTEKFYEEHLTFWIHEINVNKNKLNTIINDLYVLKKQGSYKIDEQYKNGRH